MKRRAKANPLNVAHDELVKLVQDFKQRICEKLQLSEFAYYYRIRGKINLTQIDEKVIDEVKMEVLTRAIQNAQGPIS
jgi:hypothetical protein